MIITIIIIISIIIIIISYFAPAHAGQRGCSTFRKQTPAVYVLK